MLVVEQVTELRPGDGRKAAGCHVIGLPLELEGADKITAGAGGEPTFHEAEQSRGVTYNI